MRDMLWALGLTVQVAATGPVMVFDVEGFGLSEADRALVAAAAKADILAEELEARTGPALAESCQDDAGCVRAALDGAERGVHLYAVRAGPYFEIDTTLFGPAGNRLDKRRIDWTPGADTPLLPAIWLVPGEVLPFPSVAGETAPAPGPGPEDNANAEEPPPPGSSGVLPWALIGTGGAVAAAGVVLLVGGSAYALFENGVLSDPQSPGGAKDRARITGWIGVGLAAGSVALIVGGAAAAAGGALITE